MAMDRICVLSQFYLCNYNKINNNDDTAIYWFCIKSVLPAEFGLVVIYPPEKPEQTADDMPELRNGIRRERV